MTSNVVFTKIINSCHREYDEQINMLLAELRRKCAGSGRVVRYDDIGSIANREALTRRLLRHMPRSLRLICNMYRPWQGMQAGGD